MTRRVSLLSPWFACALAALCALALSCARGGSHSLAWGVGRCPSISPEYSGLVIPPNIAPLSFAIQEAGVYFVTRVSGANGPPIEIRGRGPNVIIPTTPWRQLLTVNRGGEIRFEVTARSADGTWREYEPIVNTVANEDIDGYLAFRMIYPAFNLWRDVEIRQRDLSTYNEWPILRGANIGNGCVNCHTFHAGRTDLMLAGTRSEQYGSAAILMEGGTATKLDSKFGYAAISPDGRTIAYSLNKVKQFFHSARTETRDVLDLDSDLALFDVPTRTVSTDPRIAEKDRMETYPAWAPDGRALYFSSAPIEWAADSGFPPEGWDRVRYDLRRVAYDPDTGVVSEAETVVSSQDAGGSVLEPRVSPDGRFVLFCVCEYGCFPVYQRSSDLYMLELRTGEYHRLDINSVESESWHSWSSNSRWIAFSSKRQDGLFTRTYISYVDDEGRAGKPFVVPQKDPAYYGSCLKTYSVPELAAEPVRVDADVVERTAMSADKVKLKLPDMPMTKSPPATPEAAPPQPERE